MHFAELREFTESLQHEHGAAMCGRQNRVGRDEQNAQFDARWRYGQEAIAEMRSARPPECFSVIHGAERARMESRTDCGRQLRKRAPDTREVHAQRALFPHAGCERTSPGAEEIARKSPPTVDVLPRKQQVIFLEDRLECSAS